MKDQQKYSETNNMPKDLSDKEKKSEIKKSILEHNFKIYVNQEQKLNGDLNKTFMLIWGKCTSGLQ